MRTVSTIVEKWPIAGGFAISRGSRTHATVVVCSIEAQDASGDIKTGRGECVPYARYGETVESVMAQISSIEKAVSAGMTRHELQTALLPGAARNAVDCALWDLEAKLTGTSVADRMLDHAPVALTTAYTLSIGTPQAMFQAARRNAGRPLLKFKVGLDGDQQRIRAVRDGAPQARLILDANEGWSDANIVENMAYSAECGVELIEQPLPAGKDGILRSVNHPVTICADESLHVADDLAHLVGLYDAVNIKLDKAGGLSEALRVKQQAKGMGFRIMVGCMVGTSLAMAPAVLLAQDVDYVDLDGALLLERDREPALRFEEHCIHPPQPQLWG